MQHNCTEYPTLRHTYKEGPQNRANRQMKPRHRHTQERAHSPVTQQKTVIRGGRVGPAEPQVRPNLDWFPAPSTSEGTLPPPSQRRLPAFPRFSHPGTDLSTLYKEHSHTLSSIHHSFIPSHTQGGVVVGLHLYH